MDPRLDEDEPELAVLVLPVLLHMLANADGLLDEVVEVLGNIGSEALDLQDSQDLVTGEVLHLGDTHRVAEGDTYKKK